MHSIINPGTCITDTKVDGFNARMATRNVEENIKLIELIKERPILYDSSLVGYKDVIKKENAWLNIAMAMEWPIELCQTRWKSLRDSFRKKDKKCSPDPPDTTPLNTNQQASASPASSTFSAQTSSNVAQNPWRYTEMLSFLRSKNYRRKSQNNQTGNRTSEDAADSSDHTDHEPSSAGPPVVRLGEQTPTSNGGTSGQSNGVIVNDDAPPLDFSTNGSGVFHRTSPKIVPHKLPNKRKSSTYLNTNGNYDSSYHNMVNNNVNLAEDSAKKSRCSPNLTPPLANSKPEEKPQFGHEIRLIKRDFDEDDLFGLSVAAALKKCPEEHRLAAKIEIIRLLHLLQHQP